MARKFKRYPINEPLLIPPDLNDWVPEDHLARFMCEVITDEDVASWHKTYETGGGRGQPPYPIVMMARVLVYCYCTGRFSSRRIAQATYDDLAVRFLAADSHPDHSRISEFRRRHYKQFEKLFQGVIELARKLSLINLGHVAVDGTKLQANAARRKSFDQEGLAHSIKRDEALVKELLEQARMADEADEEAETKLPKELAKTQDRLSKLKAAKDQLDREGAQRAEQERLAAEAAEAPYAQQPTEPVISVGHLEIKSLRDQLGMSQKQLADALGVLRQKVSAIETLHVVPTTEQLAKIAEELGTTPDKLRVLVSKPKKKRGRKRGRKVQRVLRTNLTDPDSKLMKPTHHDTALQGYNAQLAVDGKHQIIVGAGVTNEATDVGSLKPMLKSVEVNCGQKPDKASADAGYCSAANLEDPELAGIDLYVATGKARRLEIPHKENAARHAMRAKLANPDARAIYNQRGAIVEPVNAHIKNCLGFKRFSLRGLAKVRAEWMLVSTCHNILKIFRVLAAQS